MPPVVRSEEDFDAGAKYHVTADVPYIRYFASHILQFMFYKEMCILSQQYDPNKPSLKPLYKCDFSNGDHVQQAGEKFAQMLQAGSSRPWPDVLEDMTGSRKLSASALVEYFQPLEEWLDQQIQEQNIPVGWNSTIDDFFPSDTSTSTSDPSDTSTTTSAPDKSTTSDSALTQTPWIALCLSLALAVIMMGNE